VAIFTGFKPTGLQKIANRLGYEGSLDNFENYLDQNPEKKRQMTVYEESAKQMARGGVVKMQEGGDTPQATGQTIGSTTIQRMGQPQVPVGGVTVASPIPFDPSQTIAPNLGTVTGNVAVPSALASTTQATPTVEKQAQTVQAQTAAPAVDSALSATQAAQTVEDDPRAKVIAAQQTASSVGNLSAAQGQATLIENPIQRQIQSGELISGVTADAEKAKKFTEQVEAATSTPTSQATVAGQLASLTANFDATNPPAWAAGAIRGVQAVMAQRGLGASSIAGQALVQAAMESALPIAQADASIQAQFETQNLSNRQQRAMLAAQQRANFIGLEFDQAFQARVQNAARIGDIANQNFNAEQQVQLENSKLANTVNLQNLSNAQALVMAQASALSSMDLSNLNNRQQSAVKNAESFLQTDMANLTNQQQTELFKAQQRIQSMFTDQAAQNASRQFNATSQNQTDQFFANLANQVAQFNASQANAQAQYNAGQVNTIERFNSELNNQRDQFNAQNQLVIAQNNAQWRRELATADTTAVNRANELNANAILDISNQAYNNLWSYYGDTMEWAWTSAENSQDRLADMAIAQLDAQTRKEVVAEQSGSQTGQAVGGLIGTVLGAGIEHGFGNLFCWVAREVYGKGDPRWFVFRMWIKYDAPEWLQKIYKRYGKWYANFISNKPVFKWATKKLMNLVVEKKRSEVYARI
tara:strand:+ start:171 stop:2273 length:2103 start_codon:yes stop_codon:yes gene_type:complete